MKLGDTAQQAGFGWWWKQYCVDACVALVMLAPGGGSRTTPFERCL